jgi:kynurenine 3-monooxygenase
MKKTTIIGGGLVGSLLAAYLGKRGQQVDVYEGRSDMRLDSASAGRSINLACSTRGWKALDQIGVGDRIREAALPMYGRMMHSPTGELTYQPYGEDGQAIYSISRGGLNKVLMSFAEEQGHVNFHFNQKCTGVDLNKPSASFKDDNTNTESLEESDLIFGADGAFSAVRATMQRQKHFDYSQTFISHDYKELSIPAVNGDFCMEKNALHIWPRGSHMLIALPNPDGSFTCTLFLPYEGENSFEQLNSDEEILNFFKTTFPDALEKMPTFLEEFKSNPTPPLAIIKCYPWAHNGKVSLIGDASHAIVPFYGQGMNSGFEDVSVLNELIDKFGEDWESILDEFQKERKPNGDAIADLALKNFIEMRDLVGQDNFLIRKKLEKAVYALYPDKFVPQYTMVSFSNIPYSEAVRLGNEQDEVLDELMKIENIENVIENGELESKLKDVEFFN